MDPIDLDQDATTTLDPAALEAMRCLWPAGGNTESRAGPAARIKSTMQIRWSARRALPGWSDASFQGRTVKAKQEALAMLPRLKLAPGDSLPAGASQGAIVAASNRLGLTFPPELIDWLQIRNGPNAGQGGIYGIRRDDPYVDLEANYARLPEWCRREYLPVAGGGFGNEYIITTRPTASGLFPVYFADHEVMADLDRPSYIAASGLWRFLWFLFRYDLGERGWPCKKQYVLEHDPVLNRIADAEFCWDS